MNFKYTFALAAAATVLEALWTFGTDLYRYVKRRKARRKEAREGTERHPINE